MNVDHYDFIGSSSTSRKPKNIKFYNQRLVLLLLRENNVMTASELSGKINLSKTTIIKILSALQTLGIVSVVGKGSSTGEGGKKPDLFALNEKYKYIMAVDFGSESVQCAIMDLKCNILFQVNRVFQNNNDYSLCVGDLAQTILNCADSAGVEPEDICCIAVGCEGIVDSANGTILFPVHHPWGLNIPVREDLDKLLPFLCHIIIENACRFSGYAELLDHPNYSNESVVTISAELSTGGCVMEHGHLRQGVNGFIGEVGHIVVDPSSTIKCKCGNCGCFETLVTIHALLSYAYQVGSQYPQSILYPQISGHQLAPEDIFQASNVGDEFACIVIDHVAHYFAILIHDIILLQDPQTIIIQGSYTQAGPYFLNSLNQQVHSFPFYKSKRNFQIHYSRLAYCDGFLIGGALYAADWFFRGEALPSE